MSSSSYNPLYNPKLASDADTGEIHTPMVRAGGFTARLSASLTRPADTNAYALGDLVADSTTAGAVTPLSFSVGRDGTGKGGLGKFSTSISSFRRSRSTSGTKFVPLA